MAESWYFQANGQVYGPLAPQQLKRQADVGTVKRDTLVCQAGAGSWVQASEVNGLFTPEHVDPRSPAVPPPPLAGKTAWSKERQIIDECIIPERSIPESGCPTGTRACPYCGETILLAAKKCKHCGEFLDGTKTRDPPQTRVRKQEVAGQQRQTDIFAILCFATGIISIFVLPILFMPACYICGIVSYYRLKENPNLKGQGLRITGWIFGSISFLYVLWLYQIGPFHPN
jgi:hypothetical protein